MLQLLHMLYVLQRKKEFASKKLNDTEKQKKKKMRKRRYKIVHPNPIQVILSPRESIE